LRATDLNQGIVYGLTTDETPVAGPFANRFDYDGIFGTVLNRFCVEAALEHPLSVYGAGGQTRSFLNIRDTVACVAIALAHPPDAGRFRVFNQFTEIFSVNEIAKRVRDVAATMGLHVAIDHVENPRVEREAHFYSSVNAHLLGLGLQPHLLADDVIRELIATAAAHREAIDPACILPEVRWSGPVREAASLGGEFSVAAEPNALRR
jgi:UDP-sulfoquinovose synthase